MSLQVWLPLIGDLRNNGIADITVTNNGTTVNDAGKLGKCYSFNGSSTSLKINYGIPITCKTWSFTCWAKLNNNSNTMCLYSQRTAVASDQRAIFIISSKQAYYDDGSRVTVSLGSSNDLTKWCHYAFVKNGTSVKIYVNGILVSSATVTQATTGCPATTFFGASQNATDTVNSNYLNGYMNDIRVYDHALSEREVKEISKGLVLHYPLNGNGRSGDNLLKNSYVNITNYNYPTVSNILLNPAPSNGEQVTISLKGQLADGKSYWGIYNSGGNVSLTSLFESHKQNGIYKRTFNWTVGSSSNTFINIYPIPSSAGSGASTVEWVKIEYGDQSTLWMPNSADTEYSKMKYNSMTEYDTSGNKYNGSKLGTFSYDTDSARFSVASVFNGTDNGVLIENLPLSNIINTEVTYAFWIKPNGENGARSVYFGSYNGTSWSVEKTTGNLLRLYWNGSPDEQCTGATITDGEWQHVCITKKGTSDVKVYINGVQKWTSTVTHSNLSFPTTYRIGRDSRSGDGTPFKGSMSDFRIYATALSADDVKELYHTGASIANNGTLLSNEFIEG